jgi:hypothetical protein
MGIFALCIVGSGLLLTAHKFKTYERQALWLAYGILIYAGIDAVRGLF